MLKPTATQLTLQNVIRLCIKLQNVCFSVCVFLAVCSGNIGVWVGANEIKVVAKCRYASPEHSEMFLVQQELRKSRTQKTCGGGKCL